MTPILRLGHRQLQRDLQLAAQHHARRGHSPTPAPSQGASYWFT
jgi:hypothetical protein